jgi:phosphate:Na+ symporter
MDEKEYSRIISENLVSLSNAVEAMKKVLFSRDKKRMKETIKEFYGSLKLSLPLINEIMARQEKSVTDKKIIGVVPTLQQMGIATEDLVTAIQVAVETDVAFTDKALAEISEVMSLLKDLARDTNDVFTTGNQDFCRYVLSLADRVQVRVNECALEHQGRLLTGACTPKASFVYLDIIYSAKRIAQELARLCQTT